MSREHLKEAAAAREAEEAQFQSEAEAQEATPILLTSLGARTPLGCNRGVAHIKRTTVDEKGRERVEDLIIPIKTEGVNDVIKRIRDSAKLSPPTIERLVLPGSDLGRELGLTAKQVVQVLQPEDEGYQKRLNEYNLRIQWALVATAVDLRLEVLPPGQTEPREATSLDERIDALRQAGLTDQQSNEIAGAVQRILTWTKQERVRFFGESLE
jgi:hypothetical protein